MSNAHSIDNTAANFAYSVPSVGSALALIIVIVVINFLSFALGRSIL